MGDSESPKQKGWEPVFLNLGGERSAPRPDEGQGKAPLVQVRILCGAYDRWSPFIEGGCATDWIEDLGEVDYPLECPRCRQRCPAEIVGCAKEALASRSVYVVGCSHQGFTFSRRIRPPHFNADGESRNSSTSDR